MIARNNWLVFRFAFAFLFLFSTAALAQSSASDTLHIHHTQTPEERARIALHNRLVDIVNAMTSRANAEGADFNKHIAEMNAAAPLETAHLDSVRLAENIPLVLGFLKYLKTCRHSSDSLDQAFNDSLAELNADLPAKDADEGIKDIGDSFNEDRAAYNNFLAALDKVYGKVLDILLYLQRAQYTIVKDRLTFNNKDTFDAYSKLLDSVDSANAELTEASAVVQKANADANEKVKRKNSGSSK